MTQSRKLALFLGLIYTLQSALAQSNINVLILHEEGLEVAKSAIDSALLYLSQNPNQGVTVNKKYTVALTSDDDVEKAVNETCKIVDAAIDSNNPPHLVLDVTRNGLISETAKSFTRALGLPTFSASFGQVDDLREWRDLTDNEKQYLVQLMPPGDIMVQVIRDIVPSQNITNAAILYSEPFVMEHKYKSLLQNIACRHIMLTAENSSPKLRKQLKKLKEADIVNYFVVGTSKVIRNVMTEANANMMFGRKFSWYAISEGDTEIGCSCENATVVALRPKGNSEVKSRMNILKGSYQLTATPEVDAAFYFDFAVRGLKAIGSMAAGGKFDNFEHLKCNAYNGDNLPDREGFDFKNSLKQVSMVDTWAPIRWGENGESYPEIPLDMDKIQILDGKSVQSKSLGQWDAGMPGALVFKAGQNLKEHQAVTVYRAATVLQAPFMMKKEVDGKTVYEGYCKDLIEEIQKIVQFEVEIYDTPDGKFGTMNEKMEWNGMIKELIDKKADIALAPLSVMAERENVVDFTVPYYDLVGITILMKKPKVPTSLFKFLTVLEPEVWICILVAYAFTSLLLWIFDRFSPYSYQNNKEKYEEDDEKREFTLKECLWFCMTSLTPQGGGEAPKNLSGRLVAATWWLFGFIIIASYTANLAAFLTVSRLDTPIESLTDLSTQYKVQYAPLKGSATTTYFERMSYIEKKFYEIWKDMSLNDSMSEVERAKLAVWDYPVSDKYTKMWQSMKEAGLPETFEEALDRVRGSKSSSEGFAFLGDATDIRYQVLTNCDFQIIGEEFSRKPYALAVQQGSPLKDQFNDAILKLLNQRKLETLKEKWWNQNPLKKKCDKENDQSDGISIENIGGVFIVIFVGIGLACITLIFEYWWYKHRKGGRTSDSSTVMPVKGFPDDKKDFGKTNFNTEFKSDQYDVAPTGGPW